MPAKPSSTKANSAIVELEQLLAEQDPRTIAQMKADDLYDEGTITEATLGDGSWSISWREHAANSGSWGCGCPAKDGLEIKAGDTIRIYGKGFGFEYHGIDINGEEVFWRTPWERFVKRVGWLAKHDREQRERFEKEKSELDGTYDGLSPAMKARIDRFRAAEPDFRVKGESYEIFACSQAEVFAARALQAATLREGQHEIDKWFADGSFEREQPRQAERPVTDLTPAVKWLLWWSKLPYDRQKELMPGMDSGHSGNTFGASWFYGVRLLLGEDV